MIMINEYLYDSTFEGLLTCIFYSYSSKEEVKITKSKNYLPSLISSPIKINGGFPFTLSIR